MSIHQSDALYSSFSQIHRAIVQYSSTATGEIQVIIPSVTGNETTVPISFFGRKEHPFENDWVVPNIGDTIIVCREDEDYTNTFWINTTYNPVRADVGEANPTSYHFGPHGSTTGAFTLIDYAATPASSGLFMGSVNMGYYNATASEWRTYMDYNGNFYLRGSGTNALTWNGSTLAVSGAITASTIDIGTGNTILKVDAAGNLSIGHATPSSAPFQVSNAGAVTASNLTITGGQITGLNSTGINIGSGAFTVSSAGAVTASNLTVTGGQITGLNSTGISINGGVFAVTSAGALTATNATITGAIQSGSTIAGAAITAGTIDVPASSPKFSVSATGVLTAVDGIFSGELSAGTISGDWAVGSSGELKIAAPNNSSTTMTLKASGDSAGIYIDVPGQSNGGYIIINKASDHSNLQLFAPALTGTDRPGMTIKHYTGGGSYVNIGTSDSDPQILLQDTGTGTATITSTDVNLNASGVLYLRAPQISLATANTDQVYVDYNGIYLGNDSPASTAHKLYRSGNDLHWNGSAIGGGTTYTFSSPLSESSGTVSIDLSGYSTTSHNHSGVYATSSHNHSGTYLELGGGTMTGTLNLGTGTKRIEGGSGGGLMIDSSGSAYLRANDEGNFGVTAWSGNHTTIYNATSARIVTATNYNVSYADLVPSVTGTYNLGYSTGAFKWNNGYFSNNVYTHDGGVHVSDVSQKTDVVDSILGLDFINAVRPVSYKWVETEDRAGVRTHHGFIAQEIEAVLGDDATAMALWCNVHQPALAAEELPEGHVMEAVEESYTQSLRYTELVPILTKALQEISTKLDAAEARIATLESA